MEDRGIPTLFKYQYFTVDAKERQNWNYNNLDAYLCEYSIQISEELKKKFESNNFISTVLDEIEKSSAKFKITRNESERYYGEKQYIKCRISKYILKQFKKIFISTLVYESEKMKIPESEAIVFEFDNVKKTVTIIDITVYQPKDNPFFKYARNAVDSLSVEAVGLEKYSVEKKKEIRDFYDRSQMTPWKERKYLKDESEVANRAGVYMLYNENENTFYIGKAGQLKNRMLQHAEKQDDCIHSFTHYRYSVISSEYYGLLYLIENAAIHDFAWVLDMPSAKKYTPSLVKKVKAVDLSKCRMVNTVEHQTRRQE